MKNNFHAVFLFISLILFLLLLSGCAAGPLSLAVTTELPGLKQALPEAVAPETQSQQTSVTLYFRFGTEPYLAAETRVLTVAPDTSRELALVTALLAGPGSHATELNTPFPTGTRVTDVTIASRTAFVTLSAEFLKPFDDEPETWREDVYWRAEVPIRRRLAVQSLTATMTENAAVDRVQILVEPETEEETDLRLQESYYALTDSSLAAFPAEREENLLLTPLHTLQVILENRQARTWSSLYLYVADIDPDTEESKAEFPDFVTLMESLPVLSGFVCEGGSVSRDGTRATFTVHATVTENGRTRETGAGTLHLYRVQDLWKISISSLSAWPEE